MSLPTFQAQNPAISGYPLGWSSCTAFSAAMVASFDQAKARLCTGGEVRKLTGDTTGGLNLAQIDAALNEGWDVNLAVTYRMPWARVEELNETRAMILQGLYLPIAMSRYDAGRGFRGTHAIAVMPRLVTMDPLADGRAAGVYKYHGEAYPDSLLRSFAGGLSEAGPGYAYVAFSHPQDSAGTPIIRPWEATVSNRRCGVYTVVNGLIRGSRVTKGPATFTQACTAPRVYRPDPRYWPGHTSQSLVKIIGGSHDGWYIRSSYAHEV